MLAGGPPCADSAVSWPPVFLITSRRGLRRTIPSSRGSLAAPQRPPGSRAPPAHAESKQAQGNTTHVQAIDAGTSADPECGAQTLARLAGSVSPVMSDMCSVVCEPAALAARPARASLSGRILNQAEPPALAHVDIASPPPSPPASRNVSPARKIGGFRHQGDSGPSRPLKHLLRSFSWLLARTRRRAGPGPPSWHSSEACRPRTQGLRASGWAPATWPALPWQLFLPAPDFPSSWPHSFSQR